MKYKLNHSIRIFALLIALSSAANAQDSQTSLQSLSSPSPEATSSSALKIENVIQTPKRLKFSLLTSSYVGVDSANKGNGDLTAFNQIRADLKIAPDQSVRFNQLTQNSWGTRSDGKQEFKFLDPYVQYARTNLAPLPLGLKLNGNARAYLPVSESSQDKGQAVSARLALEILKEVNPDLSFALNIIPSYNVLSKESYEVRDASGKTSRKPNSPANLWYYLTANVNLSKKLIFIQDFGLMRYWHNSDVANKVDGKTKEYFYADSSLTYVINDFFEVGIGVSEYLTRDLLAQANSFSTYRGDETDYYFSGTMHF